MPITDVGLHENYKNCMESVVSIYLLFVDFPGLEEIGEERPNSTKSLPKFLNVTILQSKHRQR